MGILESSFISIDKKNIELILSEIISLTNEDKEYMKENMVEISQGASSYYPVKTVVRKISEFMEKQSQNTKNGAISEFFLVCILRNQEFEQEYCYRNLEENSIKKGFDGVFTKNGELWLTESKSSYTTESHNYEHKSTIVRAYKGISDQLEGKTSNDPWENAVSHSRLAKSSESLIKKLSELSINYTEKKFSNIKFHNVILGSTIISERTDLINCDCSRLNDCLKDHEASKEFVVLINLKSISIFTNFIEEVLNDD